MESIHIRCDSKGDPDCVEQCQEECRARSDRCSFFSYKFRYQTCLLFNQQDFLGTHRIKDKSFLHANDHGFC